MEFVALTEKSASVGIDRADFIRQMVLNGEIKIADSVLSARVAFELNKIGTNLNQAVALLHIDNRPATQIRKIIENSDEICLMLRRVYGLEP